MECDATRNTMETQKLADRLLRLREKVGLSLRELGRMAGMSPAAISAIEKGQSSPTLATLHKVLKALGTDFAEFFVVPEGGEDQCELTFSRGAMKVLADGARRCVLAFPKREDIQFELAWETIEGGEDEAEWEVHDCDVGGIVISGGGGFLEVEGRVGRVLEIGDAFYIPEGAKHRVVNQGAGTVELVTAFYPARY